jgi:RNA polymerase sigma-70 factor (ECF subfamily)
MDEVTRLARAARSGDPAAIAAFVRATQADVWRLAAHLVDPQTADDLVQETYLRTLRALPRFRAAASGRTWLLSIARRACMDELRARDRVRRRDLRLGATRRDAVVPDPTGVVGVHELLDRLDVDRRTAFVLTQVSGLSYAEAARACGCPVGTIRSRVARAREELIAALRADDADDVRGEHTS